MYFYIFFAETELIGETKAAKRCCRSPSLSHSHRPYCPYRLGPTPLGGWTPSPPHSPPTPSTGTTPFASVLPYSCCRVVGVAAVPAMLLPCCCCCCRRRSAHVRMTNDRNLRQFFFPGSWLFYFVAYFTLHICLADWLMLLTISHRLCCPPVCVSIFIIGCL